MVAQAEPHREIRTTTLMDALSQRYLSYALSTIMSRSLPDVRDGLKPVHRRVVYAMHQLRLNPDQGYKKCARVVGDVIGKYHPHGEQAVYDALVRLAQEFAVRYPLVDGQGNFGSIDGDNAAAMRYTEARLTAVAAALLDGIGDDAVDFRATYDGEADEPVVLPANFPNLLANGASGIAVGMATSVPPHNVAEICDALLYLLRHPNALIVKLVEFMPGPDLPTGGILVENRDAVVAAYEAGKGGFRVRARWSVEDLGRGQYQIVVSEIPYQVQKARLIEKIVELLHARKLPMLADIRDESAEDVRIVLEPKSRNIEADMVMEHLFRTTELEVRVPLNMNVLDADRTPRVMSLREILQAYIDHRHVVLNRRTRHRLARIGERLEALGGFMIAYLNLDEVIRLIREEDDPKARMIERWELSDAQAEAILNMRLRSLRRLEEIKIRTEMKNLNAEQSELSVLLKDESRRFAALSDEFRTVKAQFGADPHYGPRRTEIGDAPTSVVVPLTAFVEREPVTVVCSLKGWLRTTKGHAVEPADIKYKEGDRGRFIIAATTTDRLIVFATNGRFYTIGVDKLPGGRGYGEPVRLLLDIGNDADVVDMFVHRPGRRLLVSSSDGRGFVVAEDEIVAQTRGGKQVLNVSGDVEAHRCTEAAGDHVAVVGTNRKLLIFPLRDLPQMARGRGVKLQSYTQAQLADAVTFVLDDGLSVATGERSRTFDRRQLADWIGKRAQAGRIVPAGFPRSGRLR